MPLPRETAAGVTAASTVAAPTVTMMTTTAAATPGSIFVTSVLRRSTVALASFP